MTKDRAAIEREYDAVMGQARGVIKAQNEQRVGSKKMRTLKRAWVWTHPSPAERFLDKLPEVLSRVDYMLNRLDVCSGGFDINEPLHVYGVRLANTVSPINRDYDRACKAADFDVLPILGAVRTTSIALVAAMYKERMGFSCCDVPKEVQAYMEEPERVDAPVLDAPKVPVA